MTLRTQEENKRQKSTQIYRESSLLPLASRAHAQNALERTLVMPFVQAVVIKLP